MRSRVPFLFLLFAVGSFAVPHLAHASIPFFGPIIPPAQATCPAGFSLLLQVINRIIELAITLAIVFVAPITIAWAGFLLVTNQGNAGKISQAKDLIINTIAGIVIALAAWMIVDAVLVALTNKGVSGWTSLIAGNGTDVCLPQAAATSGPASSTGVAASGAPAAPPSGSGACDPAVLQQDLPSLTQAQANTFACLAKPESSCGSRMQNYSWNVPNKNGLASTAYGAFQVTLSGNHSCFENQACYTAAGISGPLNCQNGFGKNGFTTGGDPTVLANCTKAAANLTCNLTAATCVLQKQGWSAWTADSKSSTQAQCIATYGG